MINSTVLRRVNEQWRERQDDPVPLPGWAAAPTGERLLSEVARAPDRTLLMLLQAAAMGVEGAGRVVVQAMLPKMVKMAAGDPRSDLGDYLAHLWVCLSGYPRARRPHRVAANLALDTLKAVKAEQREARRLYPVGEVSVPVPRPSPGAGEVISSAHGLGLIDDPTRQLLTAVYVYGLTSAEAGHRLGVSADLVRWRCSRAVRRMAGHADLLAA